MKYNFRFLNYAKYANFKKDLEEGKILEDSIVFILDKRCIWARDKEYEGNARATITGDAGKEELTVTVYNEDGTTSTIATISVEELRSEFKRVDEAIAGERNRALSEERRIEKKVDDNHTDIVNLTDALNKEIQNRENGDANLANDLSTETNRATNAEEALSDRVSGLENLVGDNSDGVINRFNEIVKFLENIGDTNTLYNIIQLLETKADHDKDKKEIWDELNAHKDELGNLLATKQDNLIAGEGIDIEEDNIINVIDYVGKAEINDKLETLQKYLGDLYVLKADVYKPEDLENWSEPTIYQFGSIPHTGDKTPYSTTMVAI